MERAELIKQFENIVKMPTTPSFEPLPDGYITDEYKAVIWNREQVEKSKEAYRIEKENLALKKNKACEDAIKDTLQYIMDAAHCNFSQASLVFKKAYKQNKLGYNAVFDEIDEIVSFVDEFQNAAASTSWNMEDEIG